MDHWIEMAIHLLKLNGRKLRDRIWIRLVRKQVMKMFELKHY